MCTKNLEMANLINSLMVPAAWLSGAQQLVATNQEFEGLFQEAAERAATLTSVLATVTAMTKKRENCRVLLGSEEAPRELLIEILGLKEEGYLLLASSASDNELLTEEGMLEAIGKISGRLGHDFNNLIGSIMGCMDLMRHKLEKHFPQELPVKKQMDIIDRAIKKATNLTDRMRTYVRPGEIEAEPVALVSLVQKSWEKISPQEKEGCEIEFANNVGANQDLVLASEFQMVQLFRGLLENALDALPEYREKADGSDQTEQPIRRIKATITRTALATNNPWRLLPGNYGVVQISDSGCGLSANHRKNLFRPFFVNKASTIGRGLGLGLPMARATLRKLKGTIFVEPATGAGFAVTVYLPASEEPSSAVNAGSC